MLTIKIPAKRLFNAEDSTFIYTKETVLVLEHSLVSISKWESKWHVPFVGNGEQKKTREQTIDYIKHMTITQNVDPLVYNSLTEENYKEVTDYIANEMTATWFGEQKEGEGKPRGKKEIITSELIYYWMISLEIPFECQRWHLNRLMTLIKVCNAKAKAANTKQSKKKIMTDNAALNAARKQKLGSSG